MNRLPNLHSNQELLDIFPQNMISITYKMNKNLSKKYYQHYCFLRLPHKENALQKNVRKNMKSIRTFQQFFLTLSAQMLGEKTKLREFQNMTVETIFI